MTEQITSRPEDRLPSVSLEDVVVALYVQTAAHVTVGKEIMQALESIDLAIREASGNT